MIMNLFGWCESATIISLGWRERPNLLVLRSLSKRTLSFVAWSYWAVDNTILGVKMLSIQSWLLKLLKTSLIRKIMGEELWRSRASSSLYCWEFTATQPKISNRLTWSVIENLGRLMIIGSEKCGSHHLRLLICNAWSLHRRRVIRVSRYTTLISFSFLGTLTFVPWGSKNILSWIFWVLTTRLTSWALSFLHWYSLNLNY